MEEKEISISFLLCSVCVCLCARVVAAGSILGCLIHVFLSHTDTHSFKIGFFFVTVNLHLQCGLGNITVPASPVPAVGALSRNLD